MPVNRKQNRSHRGGEKLRHYRQHPEKQQQQCSHRCLQQGCSSQLAQIQKPRVSSTLSNLTPRHSPCGVIAASECSVVDKFGIIWWFCMSHACCFLLSNLTLRVKPLLAHLTFWFIWNYNVTSNALWLQKLQQWSKFTPRYAAFTISFVLGRCFLPKWLDVHIVFCDNG